MNTIFYYDIILRMKQQNETLDLWISRDGFVLWTMIGREDDMIATPLKTIIAEFGWYIKIYGCSLLHYEYISDLDPSSMSSIL